MNKIVSQFGVFLGCDPEAFFFRNGEPVGSEKIIPEEGLPTTGKFGGKIVRDGVQVELHPTSTSCRANVGNSIKDIMVTLNNHLISKFPDVSVSFADVVKVGEREFTSLSPDSRRLGCMPSLNIYRPSNIAVNPETYRKRSAGGHIHMSNIPYTLTEDLEIRTVKMLDAIVGNTCVLIDRSPNAALRRRVYGRAGEYRVKGSSYLEYRTLSNFWLKDYRLMSLVMALCRQAISVVKSTDTYRSNDHLYCDESSNPSTEHLSWYGCAACNSNDFESVLYKDLDMKKVVRAINKNDLTLAQENWEVVKKFISTYFLSSNEGLNSNTIPSFEFFAKMIQENGLEYWFGDDPMKRWVEMKEGHGIGWESYCSSKLYKARVAYEKMMYAQETLHV
jgi:hypothetical protein